MRPTATLLLAAVFAAGGCATGAPATPEAPPEPPLAYGVPDDPTAVYVQVDTALVQVDAGGQQVDVTVTSDATLEMRFEPSGTAAARVVTDFREFRGVTVNPMAGRQEVGVEEIEGPLVFDLSETGEGTVVERPELGPTAASFVSPAAIAATFFPRLPARPVDPGATWVDTVSVDASEGGTTIGARSILTYTVVGDTLVDGRTLLRVDLTGEDTRTVQGEMQGMDMSQDLTGTSQGYFLWDRSRGLPARVVYRSDMRGTMEVSAAPFPLSIRARSTTRIDLQEPEPPVGG